ncbi:fimbrial protein [Enterobacter quasiroggenkampii]|uniref:fimbrial protein n=1 Tax=Enterobacter quasiroggenkampii TaxID=2497436 RepID=UPI0021D2E230|nr:fimbrial protein [Enterobacter quasiroggenkampii]
MNRFQKIVLPTVALFGISMGCAQFALAADPVSMTITGNVVASPCVLKAGQDNLTVDLGGGSDLQTADLNDAGSSSMWKPITISMESCPAGTSSVTATFHGTADSADVETLYSNTGTATNVAVQLEGTAGEAYGNGKTSVINIADAAGGIPIWNLQTRAFSKNGKVTPGTISAVITMSFAYN